MYIVLYNYVFMLSYISMDTDVASACLLPCVDGVRSRLVVTVSTVAFLCLVSCVIILVVVVAFLAMRRQLQASGAHLSLPTKGGQELEQGLMPTPTTTEPKTADY